jgi:hypothetical protein
LRVFRRLSRFVPELIALAGALLLVVVARGRWVGMLNDLGDWYSETQSLLLGDRLFRDVHIGYGPISLLVLEGLAKIAGPRVQVFAVAYFVVGLAVVLLLLRLSSFFLGLWERCVAAAVFVGIILWMPGTGSLIYPYAPAASIGLVLLALALLLGVRQIGNRRLLAWVPAGVFAGLAFLTKQEVGIAAVAGLAAAFLLTSDLRQRWSQAIAMSLGFLLTVAAIYGWGFRGLDFLGVARENHLWPFGTFPGELIKINSFVAGYDRPILGTVEAAGAAGLIALGIGFSAALDGWLRKVPSVMRRGLLFETAGLVLIAVEELVRRHSTVAGPVMVRYPEVHFTILSLAPLAPVGAVLAVALRRRWPVGRGDAALAATAAAAAPLLMRVGFLGWTDSPFAGLGYAVVVPVVVWCVGRLARVPFHGHSREFVRFRRWAASAAILLLLGMAAATRLPNVAEFPLVVEPFSAPRGTVWLRRPWSRVFAWVGSHVRTTRPGDPIAILPETHGMDFLFDRKSATPIPNLLPGILDEDLEREIVARWSARPPREIFVIEKEYVEFETRGFGLDYGSRLGAWIDAHYAIADEAAFKEIRCILYVPNGSSGAASENDAIRRGADLSRAQD